MSAFLCTDYHVSALAAYAVRHGLTRLESIDLARMHAAEQTEEEYVGHLFRAANQASVNDRYQSADTAPFRFDSRARNHILTASTVEVLKAVDCFAYQCDEADDWEGSWTRRACNEIKAHAIHRLPGYDDATWGFVPRSAS